jgi:hypothetical protein
MARTSWLGPSPWSVLWSVGTLVGRYFGPATLYRKPNRNGPVSHNHIAPRLMSAIVA